MDVISLHGGHGYLIHQLLSPAYNKRDDEWADPTLFVNRVIASVREHARRSFSACVSRRSRVSRVVWIRRRPGLASTRSNTDRLDFLDVSAATTRPDSGSSSRVSGSAACSRRTRAVHAGLRHPGRGRRPHHLPGRRGADHRVRPGRLREHGPDAARRSGLPEPDPRRGPLPPVHRLQLLHRQPGGRPDPVHGQPVGGAGGGAADRAGPDRGARGRRRRRSVAGMAAARELALVGHGVHSSTSGTTSAAISRSPRPCTSTPSTAGSSTGTATRLPS